MRILLRHTSSQLYYQGPGKWTDDPERSCDFRFIDLALDHARDTRLQEVELAFAFDAPRYITTVPLARAALRYAVDT